jgi:uncharacterized protein YyaL (SSP411 family)
MDLDLFQDRLQKIHSSLLRVREQRPKPGLDGKVLVSWNALMSVTLSECYKYVGVKDCLSMAMRNMRFILDNLIVDNHLMRSWRNGKASQKGFLEDYASLILALLALYQVDPDPDWYQASGKLVKQMIEHFYDPNAGFFDTSDLEESLIVRPKEIQDNAVPSGNALAVTALLYFHTLSGDPEIRQMAERILGGVSGIVSRYPLSFSQWLCAIDLAVNPIFEIAILGNKSDPATQDLVKTVWSTYRPNAVVAISDLPVPPASPPLLVNRSLLNNLPTAYVCRSFVCNQPVNYPLDLSRQLDDFLIH